MEVTEKHLGENRVIDHNQHEFMRNTYCLTNLISFHGKVTYLAQQETLADTDALDLSKVFNTVSHYVFLDNLSKTQLDMSATQQVKNWLMCQA